jgi:hypothetical protein
MLGLQKYKTRKLKTGQMQWLMPIISSTQEVEVEMRRLQFEANLGKKDSEIPSTQ